MNRLVWKTVALLALVWGGWWWIATTSMQNTLTDWLEARRSAGQEATISRMERGGFPMRIATTLTQTRLADPAAGTRLEVLQFTIETPIYWPGHATLSLPAGQVSLRTPQGLFTLSTEGTQAALRLHPGPALQLQSLSASGAGISVDGATQQILSVQSFTADMRQSVTPETYILDLTATGLVLAALFPDSLVPHTPFEPVSADVTVTFDRPWDRSILQDSRPQPRTIAINGIRAIHSGTGFILGGDLEVDAGGIPSGTLRLQVRNWQGVFDLAVGAAGTPDWAPLARRTLASLSDTDGALDLDIVLEQGQMRIGFVPLGPAPRLVIR
jgi:hypothetical protein